jgi:hypothetical protein
MANPSMTEKMRTATADAIDRLALGDDIDWDVSVTLSPQGPIFMCTFSMAAPVLGEAIVHSIGVTINAASKPEMTAEEIVSGAFENLRARRTEMLAGGNGHGMHQPGTLPPSHGEPPTGMGGGLIL